MNRLCRIVCFYELLRSCDRWVNYVLRMRSHGVDDIWGWLDCSGSRYWLDEVKDDGGVWVELRDRWLAMIDGYDDEVSKGSSVDEVRDGSVDEEWLYESGLKDGSVDEEKYNALLEKYKTLEKDYTDMSKEMHAMLEDISSYEKTINMLKAKLSSTKN